MLGTSTTLARPTHHLFAALVNTNTAGISWTFDDDHLAEGSSPINWDTDGDWMNDWFEVRDDEEDGVRGDSSPIRYDSRQTS